MIDDDMTDCDNCCLFCGEEILVKELEQYETFNGRKVCMKLDCKRKMSNSPTATTSPAFSQPLKKFKQTTLSGIFESISTGEMEMNTVLSHEKSPLTHSKSSTASQPLHSRLASHFKQPDMSTTAAEPSNSPAATSVFKSQASWAMTQFRLDSKANAFVCYVQQQAKCTKTVIIDGVSARICGLSFQMKTSKTNFVNHLRDVHQILPPPYLMKEETRKTAEKMQDETNRQTTLQSFAGKLEVQEVKVCSSWEVNCSSHRSYF